MKSYRIEAALIAVGIVILGLCINNGIRTSFANNRVVSVKGLAEREVPANKVTWPILYQELGNDLVSLYATVNKNNTQIVNFLTKNGIPKEEITVNAPTLTDMNANQYSSNNSGFRYRVDSCVTVSSSNVEKVRQLILRQSELLGLGIGVTGNDYEHPLEYEYTSLNEIKPEMIAEATHKAREAAEQFAKDSNSKLGKIKNAWQGQFSIENRDANTQHIKKVRVVSSVDYYLND